MNTKQREAIALKKFSLISPVINGQVGNAAEYFRQLSSEIIDLPYLGARKYSAKTFQSWISDYRRYGFEGIVRPNRSDKGKRRKITAEIGERIFHERKTSPDMPVTVLYEKLVSQNIIDPLKISRPTVYRFIEDLNISGAFKEASDTKDSKRFAHENAGELYQADVLYGPCIKIKGKKHQTYLHMILDDASRYPMYSQFYLSQNFETLRHCFKEAVQRRGVPRLIYTDNAKIYRSQQFEYICSSLGCTLLHSRPFVPQGRGKVERFFRTVRLRFLSGINENEIDNLDTLNLLYFKWLEEDYVKKAHAGLGNLSPHDKLMSQVGNLKLISDRNLLDEIFMYRISRKIQHDATCQINNLLYETDTCFAGKRVEIRYDPEWVGDETKELPIYHDGKKAGTVKMVRFHDNAHAKRKFPGNRNFANSSEIKYEPHTISFSNITSQEVQNV